MLLVEAVKRREEDKDFWTHYLAWQTMRANGKKKSGKKWKMAFPKFMDFYKRKTEAVANGTKKEPLQRFIRLPAQEKGGGDRRWQIA